MGVDTSIITPPPLKFGINQVVYSRESALLGYLEAFKVKGAYYDPRIARNIYSFTFKKNTPNVKTSGDAIDLMHSKKISLLEEDLCTFQEALSIKYNELNREVSKTESLLSKYGKPQIDVSIEATDGMDYGNVGAAEPSAGEGGHVDRDFGVINSGDLDLILTGSPQVQILSDTNDFIVMKQPSAQIESGGSSLFTIRFAPAETGRRVGTVLIISNDPITPNFSFMLEGFGI